MSMTQATALVSVKNRLDLSSDTTFDTVLADYILAAVKRLYPRAGAQIAPQTVSISPDTYGEAFVDLQSASLTTKLDGVRLVEIAGSGAWAPNDSRYQHGTQLRLRDLPSWATQAKLYGLNRFVLDASVAANTTVPEELEHAVIWYAMSEFYENLTGNKRKYNIYMQTNGARGVDNMRDEAIYYEQRADQYIEEQRTGGGAQ
jgi:hypothetical protein